MRGLLFVLLVACAASATFGLAIEDRCGEMGCVAVAGNEGEIPAHHGISPNVPVFRTKRQDPNNEKVCKPGDETHEKNGSTCYCVDNGSSWVCAGVARQSEIFGLVILGSVLLSVVSSMYRR